jgi:oxygen-independent coproporphyrinogen III oxidase
MSPFGIYVHVPFCSSLCPYCDFAVVVGKPDLHERYCHALVEEAATCFGIPVATSMCIGGGTPTFVEPTLLARTIGRIQNMLPVTREAEITI